MTTAPNALVREETGLIRDTLLAQDAIQALVSDRVRIDHIADPDRANVVYPLLIIERTGGFVRYQGSLRDVNFDLYAYSDESSAQAAAVYDAAFLVLQATRLWAATTIAARGYAREVERPESGYNEQTRSWYARGTWTAKFAG